ncbi:MAG: hypothetical protein QW561_04275, partial [Candidatus Aenigmatarchaeota archaeon]
PFDPSFSPIQNNKSPFVINDPFLGALTLTDLVDYSRYTLRAPDPMDLPIPSNPPESGNSWFFLRTAGRVNPASGDSLFSVERLVEAWVKLPGSLGNNYSIAAQGGFVLPSGFTDRGFFSLTLNGRTRTIRLWSSGAFPLSTPGIIIETPYLQTGAILPDGLFPLSPSYFSGADIQIFAGDQVFDKTNYPTKNGLPHVGRNDVNYVVGNVTIRGSLLATLERRELDIERDWPPYGVPKDVTIVATGDITIDANTAPLSWVNTGTGSRLVLIAGGVINVRGVMWGTRINGIFISNGGVNFSTLGPSTGNFLNISDLSTKSAWFRGSIITAGSVQFAPGWDIEFDESQTGGSEILNGNMLNYGELLLDDFEGGLGLWKGVKGTTRSCYDPGNRQLEYCDRLDDPSPPGARSMSLDIKSNKAKDDGVRYINAQNILGWNSISIWTKGISIEEGSDPGNTSNFQLQINDGTTTTAINFFPVPPNQWFLRKFYLIEFPNALNLNLSNITVRIICTDASVTSWDILVDDPEFPGYTPLKRHNLPFAVKWQFFNWRQIN